MKSTLLALALAAAAPAALAQHSASHAGNAAHSPYAGMQDRGIKALSDGQIADLRAGKGMSLALAAELNGYPGPAHTLELATPLGLSEAQQRETQALFEQMQAEAIAAGRQVIEAEAALDRLFREGAADAARMQAATKEAARAQGELRAVHLHYHLRMREVLTTRQTEKYAALRGYR
jgi:Spy/CpxP family protein refolding chaperone